MKKLGKLFAFANSSSAKNEPKKCKDQGTLAASGEPLDHQPASGSHPGSSARAQDERASHPSHSATGSAKGGSSSGPGGGSQAASSKTSKTSKTSDQRVASSRH